MIPNNEPLTQCASIAADESTRERRDASSCHGLVLCCGAIAPVVIVVAFLFFESVWQVERNQKWLSSVGAEIYWQHQIFDQRTMQVPVMRQRIAKFLRPALVSDLSVVHIHSGDLGDDQLKRLSGLRSLRSLKLVSHEATDKTMETISQLEKLRHLELEGKHFSFKGLLKLRDLEQLRHLSLEKIELSTAELAVLEAVLPNAEILYRGPNRTSAYHRIPAIAGKTAIRESEPVFHGNSGILGS